MNKLEMAHDYAKILLEKGGVPKPHESEQVIDFISELSAGLADAVIAKSDVDLDDWHPDWEKIPEEYDWFAVDEDGQAYCYSFEPYRSEINDHWADHNLNHEDGMASSCSDFGYQGDWRLSLRKRPK